MIHWPPCQREDYRQCSSTFLAVFLPENVQLYLEKQTSVAENDHTTSELCCKQSLRRVVELRIPDSVKLNKNKKTESNGQKLTQIEYHTSV